MPLELTDDVKRVRSGPLDDHTTSVGTSQLKEVVAKGTSPDTWIDVAFSKSCHQVVDVSLGELTQSLGLPDSVRTLSDPTPELNLSGRNADGSGEVRCSSWDRYSKVRALLVVSTRLP